MHNKRYCENIEVYDLQAYGYWRFDVKRWFDVLRKDGVVKINLKPFENVRKAKGVEKINVFKTIVKMDEPVHTWNLM